MFCVEYQGEHSHSLEVTEQSNVADIMETINKNIIISEDGTFQYILRGNTKMKVFVEFTELGNNKQVAEEVTAILKNNYLERILSGTMQSDLDSVQSNLFIE